MCGCPLAKIISHISFFVLLLLVTIQNIAANTQCVSYSPKTCLYSPRVEFAATKCHPRTCDFNADEVRIAYKIPLDSCFNMTNLLIHLALALPTILYLCIITQPPYISSHASHHSYLQEFKCGFPETGEFIYTEPDNNGNCPDSFMTTTHRPPPPCGDRCCRGDHHGDFTAGEEIFGSGAVRYTFQPTDNSCRYNEITRGQIIRYFNKIGSPLLVAGDSMMRQFYLRLVMMMRGQQRLLDYHAHAHAQYAVCREADAFRISTSNSNISSPVPNNEHLKGRIPTFFSMKSGPGRVAGQAAMLNCSRPPINFHYMHSPRWKNQIAMIPHYVNNLQPGVKPIIFTSIGYWEGNDTVPEDYLAMLTALETRARKIVVVSVPIVRVPDAERQATYIKRNTFMKSWVDAAGEPYVFLDFQAMSSSAHPPPGGSMNNWHYMCSVAWRITCADCELFQVDHEDGQDEQGNLLQQIRQGDVERVHATEDGLCGDEMNRNMWQVALNMLLKPGRRDGESL